MICFLHPKYFLIFTEVSPSLLAKGVSFQCRRPLQKDPTLKMETTDRGIPASANTSTTQPLYPRFTEHSRRRERKIVRARGPGILQQDCQF